VIKDPWVDTTWKPAKLLSDKSRILDRDQPRLKLPTLVPKEAVGISAWVPSAPKKRHADEELPEIEEIANRIASRYAGGLTRLEEDRRNWREKHNSRMLRKISPSSSSTDLIAPLAEEHSASKARKASPQKPRVPRIRALKEKPDHERSRTNRMSKYLAKERYSAAQVEDEDTEEVQADEADPSLQGFEGTMKKEFSGLLQTAKTREHLEPPPEPQENSSPEGAKSEQESSTPGEKHAKLANLKKELKEQMDAPVNTEQAERRSMLLKQKEELRGLVQGSLSALNGSSNNLKSNQEMNADKPGPADNSDEASRKAESAQLDEPERVDEVSTSHEAEDSGNLPPRQADENSGNTTDPLEEGHDEQVLRTLLRGLYKFAENGIHAELGDRASSDVERSDSKTRSTFVKEPLDVRQLTKAFLEIVIRAAAIKVLKESGQLHEASLQETAVKTSPSEGSAEKALQPVPPPGPGPAASRPQPTRSSLKPSVQQDGDAAKAKPTGKVKMELGLAAIQSLKPVEEVAGNKDQVRRSLTHRASRTSVAFSATKSDSQTNLAPRPSITNKRNSVASWARPPASDTDLAGIPFTPAGPPESQEVTKVRQLSFDECVSLAKKHRMKLDAVRQLMEEFIRLDASSDGTLSMDEFKQAIKDRCNIPAHKALPPHLLDSSFEEADANNDGLVSFEEFLVWSSNHAFAEELVVSDPQERYLRSLARKHHFMLTEVERCYKTFNQHDTDKTGFVEENEFRLMVSTLWGCDLNDISPKRLRQFWLEADASKNEKLNFEDFLMWYIKFGSMGG